MKILVGISGGVDSAFAAKLLLERGDEVVGCILRMHEYSDIEGAERVARELGIELVVLDLCERFDREIKTYFVDEYLCGRTPNPCIVCNERVKFEALYEYAEKMGFDKIATGHYAKIISEPLADNSSRHVLCRAADYTKDQSYMLYRLPEYILAKTEFPLGELTKEEVRRQTLERGLSVADAADSQEICFLPDGGYPEYIESVAGKSPAGDFVDDFGVVLGKHNGIIRYTVGQRKGLGISLGKRMFVSSINPEKNTVTLSDNIKGREQISLSRVVFSGGESVKSLQGRVLKAKLRYTAPLIDIAECLHSDTGLIIKLAAEAKAAPGQSAVVYDGERVVFGGFID